MGYILDKEHIKYLEEVIGDAIRQGAYEVKQIGDSLLVNINDGLLMPMVEYHHISCHYLMVNEEAMTTTFVIMTDDAETNEDIGENCWCAILHSQYVYASAVKLLEI